MFGISHAPGHIVVPVVVPVSSEASEGAHVWHLSCARAHRRSGRRSGVPQASEGAHVCILRAFLLWPCGYRPPFKSLPTMYFLPLFFFASIAAIIVVAILFVRSRWSGDELLRSLEPGPVSPRVSFPPWQVIRRTFKTPSGGAYSATTVDFLRESVFQRAYEMANATAATLVDSTPRYGATFPIDTSISARFGFKRSILGYTRKSVVYVPEISHDSKRCDDWMKEGGVKTLVACSVSRGIDACFVCIESRKYSRSCVHVPNRFSVLGADGKTVDIPKSSKTDDADEGWCLPSAFSDIDFSGTAPVPIKDKTRNCNPNTGSWLLAQLGRDDGKFDSSYNWICKCRYPSLMTNAQHNVLNDCTEAVGCSPHGKLDVESQAGRVDPYVKGFCECEAAYKGDFDKAIGPVCVEENILDYGLNNVWGIIGANFDRLDKRFISPKFLELFPEEQRDSLELPDPCKYDSFTLKKVSGCEVRFFTISGVQAALCVTLDGNHVAHMSDTDYLKNNLGRYPNACMYTGAHSVRSKLHYTPDFVRGHYILSYWNAKNLPDVGETYVRLSPDVASNPDVYWTFVRILQIMREDSAYQDWRRREVKPHNSSDPLMDARFRMNDFFSDDETGMVFYNEFPDCDMKYKLTTMWGVVPLFDETLGKLYNPDLIRLWMVSDRKEFHWRHIYYRRIDQHTWQPQTVKEYNDFYDTPNCTGRGRVVPDWPVYLNYRTQTNDMDTKRFYQFFLEPKEEKPYPAYQSRKSCQIIINTDCKIWKTREEYLDFFLPSLTPSITIGNRELIPFVKNRRFDCTVQLFITDIFLIIAANTYCQNYRNYQGKNNQFPVLPDGVRQFDE